MAYHITLKGHFNLGITESNMILNTPIQTIQFQCFSFQLYHLIYLDIIYTFIIAFFNVCSMFDFMENTVVAYKMKCQILIFHCV